MGGGLGGGSADAGAILRWAGCRDLDLAASIGADVPFCLVGGRARVEGIGERVAPLDHEERTYLLLLPPFGVDTASVFGAWDAGHREEGVNALTAAALATEPRPRRAGAMRSASCPGRNRRWPAAVRRGSSRVVPPTRARQEQPLLEVGGTKGRLLRTRTVPAGWLGA